MNQKILCVIIHFGAERLTWNCIDSIFENHDLDIIIVDNDPSQSFQLIDPYVGQIKLFKAGGKASFAAANNFGVKQGRAKSHHAILLLNNDTIVDNGAISRMEAVLKNNDGIGAVGPCMPYLDHPEKIWACGGRIDKLLVRIDGLREVKSSTLTDVDYLPGAAILCRINIWDQAGGLPEKYFLAYEEAEFALRVKRLGFRIVVQPKAIILHKVGMSSDTKPKYEYNSVRNRIRFGCFLWGALLGTFWTIMLTLAELIVNKKKLMIWLRAISDELRGVPLDHSSLQKIEEEFGAKY